MACIMRLHRAGTPQTSATRFETPLVQSVKPSILTNIIAGFSGRSLTP